MRDTGGNLEALSRLMKFDLRFFSVFKAIEELPFPIRAGAKFPPLIHDHLPMPHVRPPFDTQLAVVLRNALAVSEQEPEIVLNLGVALLGGIDILQRPSGYRASKTNGKQERDDGCLEGTIHPIGPLSPV
jgi:hypothetical protein